MHMVSIIPHIIRGMFLLQHILHILIWTHYTYKYRSHPFISSFLWCYGQKFKSLVFPVYYSTRVSFFYLSLFFPVLAESSTFTSTFSFSFSFYFSFSFFLFIFLFFFFFFLISVNFWRWNVTSSSHHCQNNQLFRPVEHPLTARSFIYINVVYSVVVFSSLLSVSLCEISAPNQHKRNINKW